MTPAQFAEFMALKVSNIEYFNALKVSNRTDRFRALKVSNPAMETLLKDV